MNVVEKAGKKTGPDLRPNAVDFERFRLRRFIESLGARRARHPQRAGRSRRHRRGDGRQPEGGAVSRRRSREGGTGRQRHGRPLADRGGVRRQAERAAEGSASGGSATSRRFSRSSRAEAPCQAVVLTGDDADVTRLPVHLQHGADGGPYISAIDRLCHRSEDRLHQCRPAPADAALRNTRPASILSRRAICRRSTRPTPRRASRTPVSFVVGAHPIDHVAGVMRLPVDELGIVASLRDAPLPVVKCITNDIRVPADAEYVIEGYLDEKRPSSSRKGLTANSSAITARSSAIRCSTSPRSRTATTRCSRPRPSAARRSAAPTPRSFRRCAPRS